MSTSSIEVANMTTTQDDALTTLGDLPALRTGALHPTAQDDVLIDDSLSKSIAEFDLLNPTLMVSAVSLKGHINIMKLFPLLEITQVALPEPKKQRKRKQPVTPRSRANSKPAAPKRQKIKKPYPGRAGLIMGARHEGKIRGWPGGFFKNCITMDLSTTVKNVSVKLAVNSMHICGASSEEMIMEAAQVCIDNVQRVENILQWIRHNHDLASSTVEWVLESTLGPEVLMTSDDKTVDVSKVHQFDFSQK